MLDNQDIIQLENRNISQETTRQQLATLKAGIPYVDLRDAATINNGIYKYTDDQEDALVAHFKEKKEGLDLLKFTPASGAATRMFKFLYQFIEGYDIEKGSINAYINKMKKQDLRLFFVGLDHFPFFKKVRKQLKKAYGGEDLGNVDLNRVRFVQMMLGQDGLDYGSMPKGLIPFHSYKKHNASAFEEHLFEGALYVKKGDVARLHFTISENHYDKFKEKFDDTQRKIEKKTQTIFDITYSFQKPKTDTVALASNGKILRDDQGQIIFRPGGHGSLIENLNDLEADVIFIKNIDNVVIAKYEEKIAYYKEMLAGKLIALQEEIFEHLETLEKEQIDDQTLLKIVYFLQDMLSIRLAPDFEKYSKNYQIEYLQNLLNRPLRVCGMVKNEGEPGGGPFWVRHESGTESLQIIESVQINPASKRQQDIVNQATHFNPVDIVCGVKNYKGEKFDLLKFIDPKAGFIAEKSFQGQTIKALEHPGLWNGAMANWNTIFVEVPLVTFNPVKTVNDLLKPAHQVK